MARVTASFPAWLAGASLCFSVVAAAAPQSSVNTRFAHPAAARALSQLETDAGGLRRVRVSPATGLTTFLSTPRGKPLAARRFGTGTSEAIARGFIESYGAAFGLDDPNDAALVRASGVDGVGMEHVRFRQTHRGVPVTGGELTVHLKGGRLVAINAKTLDDLENIDVTPDVSAASAAATVESVLQARFEVTGAELSEPRLELFNRGLLAGYESFTRLAWFIEARKIDLRRYFWVDANTGMLLLSFSQLTDAKDRTIYDADDPDDGNYNDLPGDLAREEGDPPATSGDAQDDINAAYDYSGDTYDYFMNEHGRDSYDGAGAGLISTVHFCPDAGSCPYQNAFWNGVQMVYGEGFPLADDVDAHELTHAVTEHTANLFYYMQSGALNESFSDIFGETVDLTNSGGTDTMGVRWQMGEDVPGIGAIRDMLDPTTFGHPGKMSDSEFFCLDDYRSDRGGVHLNSGVPNHAYALMVDGGSYNSKTVTGIGLTKAGKVQYRTLAHYLTSASDFQDNYEALLQACDDLIDNGTVTASDCGEVQDALDAVEMADPWPCSPAPAEASYCPAGQAPDMWYFEDFESSGISACPSNGVSNSFCLNGPGSLLGEYAVSGEQSIWGYNRPATGSMIEEFFPSGSLPSNAYMHFHHSHGFENDGSTYYDGGIVEYSDDGGSSWNDAGPMITSGQDYNGAVSSCCGNPLAGDQAFVADSFGFVSSLLDLSGQAGGSFAFRFNIGTDPAVDEYGWFIDDVRIYTCQSCPTDWTLNAGHNGTADTFKAVNTVTASSGFRVAPEEDVHFQAGSSVVLEPGFSVASGGSFTVTMTSCSP